MKKLWLTIALGLLVLLVGGGIALRLVAKSFVETDEFRTGFTQVLEQAADSVIPHAMAQVKQIRLVGLASLELKGLEIRSSKRIEARFGVPRVKVTPALLSLVGSKPLRLTADGEVEGKGRFDFVANVPKSLLRESAPKKSEMLEVTGNLEKIDVVAVSSLLFSDAPSNPNFQLTRGTLTGTFLFRKPFGSAVSAGQKSGEINAKLENAEWTIAVGPVKKLKPPTLDLHVEIKDFALELRAPVVLEEKVGRAAIAGALLLPERADRTLAWNLDVKTEGLLLQGSLGKLFKCKQPPTQPHFTVKGPIAATNCAAAK